MNRISRCYVGNCCVLKADIVYVERVTDLKSDLGVDGRNKVRLLVEQTEREVLD